MSVAVVVTGNHWVLDVPAGLALAAFGLLVAVRIPAAHPPAAHHHASTPHYPARHAAAPARPG
jgi:hypothetical protein